MQQMELHLRRNHSMKTSLFEKWFEDKLLICLLTTHIIMDNASFHKKKVLYKLAEKHSQTLISLPPYSLEYNPIEKTWNALKKKIAGCIHRYGSVLQALNTVLEGN